jgi:uncharacterized membrane protein (UPF0127 family)
VLCVLEAATPAQRARGLMQVTDHTLGGYDGMVFRFGADTAGGFWMRNTPMPLRLAYLDAGGRVVSHVDMDPCADDPSCRSYAPARAYRDALEVPLGAPGAALVAKARRFEIGGPCRDG